MTAPLAAPRTRTPAGWCLRFCGAVCPESCGRCFWSSGRGWRGGHWSGQCHFSSATHVRLIVALFSGTVVHTSTLMDVSNGEYCIVIQRVFFLSLLCCVFSGKAIPNGTDKHQLGTPENEGKFQICLFLVWKYLWIKIARLHYVFLGCRAPPAGYFL